MKKHGGRTEAWLSVCLLALLAAPSAAGQVRFAALGGGAASSPGLALHDRRLGDPHQHWVSIERDKEKKLSILEVPRDDPKANGANSAGASRGRPEASSAAPGGGGSAAADQILADSGGRKVAFGPHGVDPREEQGAKADHGAGHDAGHGNGGHGGSHEGHGHSEGHGDGDHSHSGHGHGGDHSGHGGGGGGGAGAAAAPQHGGGRAAGAEAEEPAAAGGHGHGGEEGRHGAEGHGRAAGAEHNGHGGGHGGGGGGSDQAAGDGHGGQGGHPDEAHSVAVGLIAAVTLLPIGVSMALTEGTVQELTLKMLDTFISIFLAVLWFNTFQQFLITFHARELFPYANVVLAVGNVIVLYIIAQLVSYMWKDKTMRLTTFCSCGAHFIAFAGINATGWSQQEVTDATEFDTPAVFMFCAVVAVCLAALFTTNWLLWRQHAKEETEMNEAIDELEMDIIGLVLSFAVTQAVRTAITGRYPGLHFLQVHQHVKHTAWQRWFMLFWSLALTAVASWSLPRLSEWAQQKPQLAVKRTVHVVKVVLIMLVAWGFLLWGQWEFYENLFGGHGMYGHMIFAITATFVSLGVLYCMGIYGPAITNREIRETYNIVTTGISLVSAWSWEHCFDQAFDVIGEQYQVGFQGLVPKLVLSLVVPLALMPTYINHVRPRVLEMDEAHVHDEHVSGEIERISMQSSLQPEDPRPNKEREEALPGPGEEVERMSQQASLHSEEIERLRRDAELRMQDRRPTSGLSRSGML